MAWESATRIDDLPEAEPCAVRIGTRALVLVRHGDAVHAFDALCPHKFAPLQEGHVADGCLVCPVHDAHFQMDGTPRDGDGWAGQLPTHATRVVEGRVEVDL